MDVAFLLYTRNEWSLRQGILSFRITRLCIRIRNKQRNESRFLSVINFRDTAPKDFKENSRVKKCRIDPRLLIFVLQKKKKERKLAPYIFLHLIPKIQSFSGSFIFNSSSFNYVVKELIWRTKEKKKEKKKYVNVLIA